MPTTRRLEQAWRRRTAFPNVSRAFLVASGPDVTFSATGPAQFAFVDIEQDGNYMLLSLVPVYLVDDGAGNVTPSIAGPAAFVLADAGAGVAGGGSAALPALPVGYLLFSDDGIGNIAVPFYSL